MVVSHLEPLGGIEAALVSLALELEQRGTGVSLYVLNPPPRPNQHVEALEQGEIPILTPSRVSRNTERLSGRRGLLYRRLARDLRRTPPNVVHVHGWGCGEDPPDAVAHLRQTGLPLVYTEHNSPDPRIHPPISQAPMNGADLLIAVSKAGKRGLETVGGATRPIRVIGYGVEPLATPPPVATRCHGDFVVSCVARLAAQKGHLDLLEAFTQLRVKVPGARLLLAGTGPLEAEVRSATVKLGVQDAVELLGLVRRSELPSLLAETDVVALASRWEGLPVALIEALCAGKPIVTTDAGGSAELVREGENGFVVAVGDVGSLSGALIRLASDSATRLRMGAASAARFRSGEFDPGLVAEQHLDVYRSAIDLHRDGAFAG